MIQRIQTLFLIIVIILNALMFFFPVASFYSDLYTFKMYCYEIKNMTPGSPLSFGFMTVFPLLLVIVAVAGISLYTIFIYKKRILQVKLIRFCMLLTMFMIVGIFFLYPRLIEKQITGSTEFGFSAYLPLLSLLFLYLANRYILKDEKLVRSVDRLR